MRRISPVMFTFVMVVEVVEAEKGKGAAPPSASVVVEAVGVVAH